MVKVALISRNAASNIGENIGIFVVEVFQFLLSKEIEKLQRQIVSYEKWPIRLAEARMDETLPFGAIPEVDLVSPSKSPPKKKQLRGRTPSSSPVDGNSLASPERDSENSAESLSFAVSEVKVAADYLFEGETAKQITFLDYVPPDGFSIKEGTFAVNRRPAGVVRVISSIIRLLLANISLFHQNMAILMPF